MPPNSQSNEATDVLTKGSLRSILGVEKGDSEKIADEDEKGAANMSTEEMEKAMTSLEDADDVVALKGAKKEAADELKEFDESIDYKKDSDGEDAENKDSQQKKTASRKKDAETKEDGGNEEAELEKEFASWQTEGKVDASAIEASLTPMERYALRFRTTVDPFYSIFAVMEYRRQLEAAEAARVGRLNFRAAWMLSPSLNSRAPSVSAQRQSRRLVLLYPRFLPSTS